jgi:hypothetical protein
MPRGQGGVGVRVDPRVGPDGFSEVRGGGALDPIAGAPASGVRLRVAARHIRAYWPDPKVPVDEWDDRITSEGAVGYGDISVAWEVAATKQSREQLTKEG